MFLEIGHQITCILVSLGTLGFDEFASQVYRVGCTGTVEHFSINLYEFLMFLEIGPQTMDYKVHNQTLESVTVLNILCHVCVYKNVTDVLGRIYTHDFILHTVYRSVRI